MDHSASREQDIGFDLESGTGEIHSNEEGSPYPVLNEHVAKAAYLKLCDRFMSVDDNSIKLNKIPLIVNEGFPEKNVKSLIETTNVEEKTDGNSKGNAKSKKNLSAKKPPRPPGGFSLDAYDQKLIKELTELAIIKRARIERIKALKQKKSLKNSSSSTSTATSSLFAMFFTIIFFLVILFQGRNSGVTSQGSPRMGQTDVNDLIVTQNQLNLSASDSISPNSKTSTLVH